VIFGVLNEYLQSFVPGRCALVSDAVLNGIGSLSVILLYGKRCTLSVKH
jgi:VanZ family protein